MKINETKVVLEVITVCGKTMREHLEVINHRGAISYVEDGWVIKWPSEMMFIQYF